MPAGSCSPIAFARTRRLSRSGPASSARGRTLSRAFAESEGRFCELLDLVSIQQVPAVALHRGNEPVGHGRDDENFLLADAQQVVVETPRRR